MVKKKLRQVDANHFARVVITPQNASDLFVDYQRSVLHAWLLIICDSAHKCLLSYDSSQIDC